MTIPDDKNTRTSPGNKRIDVQDRDQVHNWTKSVRVTEEQLREAVARVGRSAEKAREHLCK